MRNVSCVGFLLRLIAERRGAVALLLAVAVVPLVGMVGLATDAARGWIVREKLAHALDAAGLAGGRAMLSPTRDTEIAAFFAANFPAGFLGAQVTGPSIIADLDTGELTLEARAVVPTSFVRVLGIETVDVRARAVVRRAVRGMELVLVMDNTGSMRSNGKIDAMKSAAATLVNQLYGERDTVEDFWVALVPYVASVNIGAGRTDWLATFDAALFQNSTWKGCVEARSAPYDQTDDPPSVAAFVPYRWASTYGLYSGNGDNNWTATNIDETNNAQNNGRGPNLGCGPPILPLTAEKSTVLTSIAGMLPWHRGGTMANLGLVWGWRVLSPRWRGLWGGATPADLPLDYHTPLMDKVMIILTDGENQWYDWPDGQPNSPSADYTAYGRPTEGRLGVTNGGSAATTIINNRMLAACTAMKAEGVIIYAITFQLSSSSAQNLYRSCATSPAHYFNSPSNSSLQSAFDAIGKDLTNLRLAS